MGLPKYFNDLHVLISAITGQPRIAKTKNGKLVTDKYIDIPQKEWESAILNWASMLEHGYVQVLEDFTFCFAGKAKNKKHLIQGMRKLADELEELINKQETDKELKITAAPNE